MTGPFEDASFYTNNDTTGIKFRISIHLQKINNTLHSLHFFFFKLGISERISKLKWQKMIYLDS